MPRTHLRRGHLFVAAIAAAWLVGRSVEARKDAVPSTPDRRTIEHVLNRVTFGARPRDVERIRAIGISRYLDEQLHPERIDDSTLESRLVTFSTLTMSSSELATRIFEPAAEARRARAADSAADAGAAGGARRPPAMLQPDAPREVLNELMQARMLRAVFSERQLQEVLTDFWFNHFNVFIGKGVVRQYVTEYERDAIRPNVLGHFRTLLGAVAHSPAMLFYLDNVQSAVPNARRPAGPGAPRGLNENYARELMELHTLGVDGGYDQRDVTELARILTGWSIDRPRMGGGFVFRPALHDTGTKQFLGTTMTGDGVREGERALDLLARHPSTARHIAYQLSQRFVADEPPPALVARAADVFLETQGDLRAVTRAILTSPEFFAPDAVRAQVKTPLDFLASAVRVTGAEVRNAQPLVVAVSNLGMPLYRCQPPTGYRTTADAWVNSGALLGRMNIAVQLVSAGRVMPADMPPGRAGVDPDRPQMAGLDEARPRSAPRDLRNAGMRMTAPIVVPVAQLARDTSDAARMAVVDRLLGGEASDATVRTLSRAQTPEQMIALALGSPEFQRR